MIKISHSHRILSSIVAGFFSFIICNFSITNFITTRQLGYLGLISLIPFFYNRDHNYNRSIIFLAVVVFAISVHVSFIFFVGGEDNLAFRPLLGSLVSVLFFLYYHRFLKSEFNPIIVLSMFYLLLFFSINSLYIVYSNSMDVSTLREGAKLELSINGFSFYVIILSLLFWYLKNEVDDSHRVTKFLCFIGCLLSIFLSCILLSRQSILLVFILYFSLFFWGSFLRLIFLICILSFFYFYGFEFIDNFFDALFYRFERLVGGLDGSFDARVGVLDIFVKVISDNLFGIGPGSILTYNYLNREGFVFESWYLDFMAAYGFIGVISVIILVCYFVYMYFFASYYRPFIFAFLFIFLFNEFGYDSSFLLFLSFVLTKQKLLIGHVTPGWHKVMTSTQRYAQRDPNAVS